MGKAIVMVFFLKLDIWLLFFTFLVTNCFVIALTKSVAIIRVAGIFCGFSYCHFFVWTTNFGDLEFKEKGAYFLKPVCIKSLSSSLDTLLVSEVT